MKTMERVHLTLAETMVAIGERRGPQDGGPDHRYGHARWASNIGNSLEVMESMEVLKGKGPADLTEVCLQLAAEYAGAGRQGHPGGVPRHGTRP